MMLVTRVLETKSIWNTNMGAMIILFSAGQPIFILMGVIITSVVLVNQNQY